MAADERKAGDTDEQFFYKARKKAIGLFKRELWSLPASVRAAIGQSLEDKFRFLLQKLQVPGTAARRRSTPRSCRARSRCSARPAAYAATRTSPGCRTRRMLKTALPLSQFILQQEDQHPEASGEFTDLLMEIALAAKMINRLVVRAGLVDILGETGEENVQGERVQKLDRFAHETLHRLLGSTGQLAVLASEEDEGIVPVLRGTADRATTWSTSTRSTARRTSTPTSTSGPSSRSCRGSRARAAARWRTACSPGSGRCAPAT